MKKLSPILCVSALCLFISCGESAHENTESTEEETQVTETVTEDEAEEEDGFTERDISDEEIPEAVISSFRAEYPDLAITEAEELTGPNGEIRYEIEVELDGMEMDLIYSDSGELIETEKESMDDDEGVGEEDDDDGEMNEVETSENENQKE